MTAVAQLPMYDFPEIREATDALWRALAVRLRRAGVRGVPDHLTRELADHDAWRHPRLLFGQSCGYPAMLKFSGHLRIIATPIYAAPGCEAATHCSFFLVPRSSPARQLADLRGGTFALNARDSNTGMNLPRLALAPLARGTRFFSQVIETGSHAESLLRVASGKADAMAIDCVSHALLALHRPELAAATRILCKTERSPALPFVTAHSTDGETITKLRDALADALSDPALADIRAALLLAGVVPAGAPDYAAVLESEARARRLGYGELD